LASSISKVICLSVFMSVLGCMAFIGSMVFCFGKDEQAVIKHAAVNMKYNFITKNFL